MKKAIFNKKPKKSLGCPAKHLLLGIPTNIAVVPLDFRAVLDVDPKDENNPEPSRIESVKRESEAPKLPIAGSSIVVAIPDIEQGGSLMTGDIGHSIQEAGPEVALENEQDHKDTALNASIRHTNIANEGMIGIGPLGSLLRTVSDIYADREYATIKNMADRLLSRVNSLGRLFATRPGDVAEQRRRDRVIDDLKRIGGQLRLFCGELELQRLNDNFQGDEDVLKLLEDLQDAIFPYQMARQNGIVYQGFKSMDSAEAATLNDFRCAREVEYRPLGARGQIPVGKI
ncbi:hypothetical protein BJ322DRAFT_498179 [Thelephora terrestris]|uniref:Uncharacterized protein n=1 Tax=Thelephora terrestris TaxID=56493 RepID=A0A9P6L1U5_9AGAM|nr:hypothetical protein BJ322DRAFT_498179 [Thelephora terrestris]